MDGGIRYAINCCGGVMAWFMLAADRTVCVTALQLANPQIEYTLSEVDVSDLQGENQD